MAEQATGIVAFDFHGDRDLLDLQSTYLEEYRSSSLHMTLLFLGETDDLKREELKRVVSEFAAMHAPISGAINGFATFAANSDDDDKVPQVLLFDSPNLPGFRETLKNYVQYQTKLIDQDHGFTPHITLAFTPSHVPNGTPVDPSTHPIAIPLPRILDKLSLYFGDERYDYPLSGDIVYKQLPIDDRGKKALVEIRRNLFNADSDRLVERMYTGEISLGQFEEQFRKLTRELHSSVAAIAKGGWGEMTWADWGRLGPTMKEQYRYIHGFVETIAEKRDTISLNAIKARAHMYGAAGGKSGALIQAGQVISEMLPWLPKDGSTECLVNCKCEWNLEIVGKDSDFNLVRAIWKLNPAEHCHDCIDRDGHVEMLRVHESVEVPTVIGGL